MFDETALDLGEKSADTGYESDWEPDNISPPKPKKLYENTLHEAIKGYDVWFPLFDEGDLLFTKCFKETPPDELAIDCECNCVPDTTLYYKHTPVKKSENAINSKFDNLQIEDSTETESDFFWGIISRKDTDGDNLLFISIILLNTHIACMLIDLAPSYKVLNCVNRLFQTALHLAALTGNDTVARRLLVAGAKVDCRDKRLNTALHMAVRKGYLKVAKQLLTPVTYTETKKNKYEIPFQKIPQNLEIFNDNGETCLHIAAREKNIAMIDLLINNEADINARELKSGKTILHYFAENDDVKMVKFITAKSRTDLNITTYCGITAAELAHSMGHYAIAYLLLSSEGNDVIPDFYSYSYTGSDSEDSDYSS